MAYRIMRNTRNKTLMHFTADNTAIVIVGNSSVSEIGDPNITDETITGATITQIWATSDSGAGANGWDIVRGSNTVWETDSTAWMDFAGLGAAITLDSAGTLGASRNGSRGTLIIELQKEYAGGWKNSDSDY